MLEDASVRGLSPEGWASRVAAAAARWDTALVVAEANNGGAMVESVLKAADFGLKVRLVHASQGKSARAEPIALKFETGKAFLAGEFPELEAELAGMSAGGGYEGPGRSPDRADAMVWAMTALSETRSGVPRVQEAVISSGLSQDRRRGNAMATIAGRLFEREARPDVLSGTPRAHAIDRWIFVCHGGLVHRHRAGRVHSGCAA